MTHENAGGEISRILIADDVEENRLVLRDIIMEMGYLPILTENGVQALKMAERYRPQLVILDVAMPEMDGYECCRLIKENPTLLDIPIVFISAFDDPADIVRGFNLGGADYITKPFIPEVVKTRVGVLLKLADAKQKLLDSNRQMQVAVNKQLHQMEIEKKNVLYALVRMASENVCYDSDQVKRLCDNSRTLTEAMQLSKTYGYLISDAYIDTIALAAILCDLGNVAIATDILQKEVRTEREEKRFREHTSIGAQILRDIKNIGDYNDFIQIAIDIANYHHENWDGSGYPEKRAGEDIPLAAQIIRVVGDYCRLTAGSEETGRDAALDAMEQNVGSLYNPDIFQILRKIARQLH